MVILTKNNLRQSLVCSDLKCHNAYLVAFAPSYDPQFIVMKEEMKEGVTRATKYGIHISFIPESDRKLLWIVRWIAS